jgi:hypothetical protein
MNSKGFPYVSSYQSYFSYEANLHLFDPIISDILLITKILGIQNPNYGLPSLNPKSKFMGLVNLGFMKFRDLEFCV